MDEELSGSPPKGGNGASWPYPFHDDRDDWQGCSSRGKTIDRRSKTRGEEVRPRSSLPEGEPEASGPRARASPKQVGASDQKRARPRRHPDCRRQRSSLGARASGSQAAQHFSVEALSVTCFRLAGGGLFRPFRGRNSLDPFTGQRLRFSSGSTKAASGPCPIFLAAGAMIVELPRSSLPGEGRLPMKHPQGGRLNIRV